MTPLRQKYIRDLTIRGKAENTQQVYTACVADLASYYKRSPDLLSYDQVADWPFISGTSVSSPVPPSTSRSARRGSCYRTTLGRDTAELLAKVPRLKRETKRAHAYSVEEVEAILKAAHRPRDIAFLRTVYERVGEIAAKAAVQLLLSTGKSFTVDGLREKLREFFRQEVRPELRAVAALSNVELITALLSCNQQLALVGLQLRIINGVVSLLTTEVRNRALAAYLSDHNGANGNSGLTTATLEVLACIAFKQPISQAEIDLLFDADKRGLVVTLRDLKLVEEFAGSDGRLRFTTTQAFLQRFGLTRLSELTATSFLDDHRQQFPTSLI